MWKTCGTCKKHKPLYSFNRHRSSKFGIGNRCKVCANKRRKLASDNRRNFIGELKVLLGCQHCGYKLHYSALDIHHIHPEDKEYDMQDYRRKGNYKQFKPEILKCVILCRNCHQLLHNNIIELELDEVYYYKLMSLVLSELELKYNIK